MSEFWENLNNKDLALDAILTGYKGDAIDMPVYEEVVKALQPSLDKQLLDFGCGAGRNISGLKDSYRYIIGYDYPNMLEFVPRETSEAINVKLTSSLDVVCGYDYDDILYSLVLQHIHPDEMRSILMRLRSHGSRHIIHSRTWVDFTFEPIMPILEEFFKVESIEYQKDPNSNENDHFIGVFLNK